MYKIRDFSKKTGVAIDTLRYYDKIDFFKPLYTDFFSGYRYYIDSQADEMIKIQKLKNVGLSLKEISDFLKTKDVNILLKKKNEFEKMVDSINMIMMEKVNAYEIKKADFAKYIELNGTRYAKGKTISEIKNGDLYYYIIYKDGEFYADFSIDKKESWLRLCNTYDYVNKILMKEILTKISEVTDYITFFLLNSDEKLNRSHSKVIDEIENLFPSIKKENSIQGEWHFFKYTLNIADGLLTLSKE